MGEACGEEGYPHSAQEDLSVLVTADLCRERFVVALRPLVEPLLARAGEAIPGPAPWADSTQYNGAADGVQLAGVS